MNPAEPEKMRSEREITGAVQSFEMVEQILQSSQNKN